MGTDSTSLGDRMKDYEAATRMVLPRRTYTIIRVDGRAFHTYLKGAQKPFDYVFMEDMSVVARTLCAEIAGTAFAYAQSDEISLLVTDFGGVHTEPWFGGNVQKIVSVSAALATSALGQRRPGTMPLFDSRVFTIPSPVEVANYFLWRQRDAVRNSVSMAAQAHFSHRRLQGLSGGQMQELLFSEAKVNWNAYPDAAKRGLVMQKVIRQEEMTYTDKRTSKETTITVPRSYWMGRGAPHFVAEPVSWLADTIPSLPTLEVKHEPPFA